MASSETVSLDLAEPLRQLWGDALSLDELRSAGGSRSFGDLKQDTALLVIDLFEMAFRPGPLSCEPAASAAVPALEELLAVARQMGVPVVHTTGEDRGAARPHEATYMISGQRSDEELSGDYSFHPRFVPRPNEAVVYKSSASAFFETRLRTILQALGAKRLVIIGESTSGCVRASVVDAFSCGFDVLVPLDAVFDRSPTSHRVNLFDLHVKYATVTTAQEVIEAWEGP